MDVVPETTIGYYTFRTHFYEVSDSMIPIGTLVMKPKNVCD